MSGYNIKDTCFFAPQCPTGWKDHGQAGSLIPVDDGAITPLNRDSTEAHAGIEYLFNNRLCCAEEDNTNLSGIY